MAAAVCSRNDCGCYSHCQQIAEMRSNSRFVNVQSAVVVAEADTVQKALVSVECNAGCSGSLPSWLAAVVVVVVVVVASVAVLVAAFDSEIAEWQQVVFAPVARKSAECESRLVQRMDRVWENETRRTQARWPITSAYCYSPLSTNPWPLHLWKRRSCCSLSPWYLRLPFSWNDGEEFKSMILFFSFLLVANVFALRFSFFLSDSV